MNDPLVHDGAVNFQLKSRPNADVANVTSDKSEPSSESFAGSNREAELIDADIRVAAAKLKLEQLRQKKLTVSGPPSQASGRSIPIASPDEKKPRVGVSPDHRPSGLEFGSPPKGGPVGEEASSSNAPLTAASLKMLRRHDPKAATERCEPKYFHIGKAPGLTPLYPAEPKPPDVDNLGTSKAESLAGSLIASARAKLEADANVLAQRTHAAETEYRGKTADILHKEERFANLASQAEARLAEAEQHVDARARAANLELEARMRTEQDQQTVQRLRLREEFELERNQVSREAAHFKSTVESQAREAMAAHLEELQSAQRNNRSREDNLYQSEIDKRDIMLQQFQDAAKANESHLSLINERLRLTEQALVASQSRAENEANTVRLVKDEAGRQLAEIKRAADESA